MLRSASFAEAPFWIPMLGSNIETLGYRSLALLFQMSPFQRPRRLKILLSWFVARANETRHQPPELRCHTSFVHGCHRLNLRLFDRTSANSESFNFPIGPCTSQRSREDAGGSRACDVGWFAQPLTRFLTKSSIPR
jgi:hypothetical protein